MAKARVYRAAASVVSRLMREALQRPQRSALVMDQLENRTLLTAVTSIQFDPDTPTHNIVVTFDSAINPSSLSTSDLIVRKVGSDSRISAGLLTLSLNSAHTQATFGKPAQYPDGDYSVQLLQDDVLDASGNMLDADASASFFYLYGDATGPDGFRDRTSDNSDYALITSNLDLSPALHSQGDLNYDGSVTEDDYDSVTGATLATPVVGVSGLTASEVPNGGGVQLSWVHGSPFSTGYRVQRSSDRGRSFTTIASSLSADSVSYLDSTVNVSGGANYLYRVRSIEPADPLSNVVPPSAYAVADYQSVSAQATSPIQPVADLAVQSAAQNALTISWIDTSTQATGYEIWRSENGGPYTPRITLDDPSATGWTDTSLNATTTYAYEVRTLGETTSGFSNTDTGTTLAGPPTLIAADLQVNAPQVLVAKFDQPIFQAGLSLDGAVSIYSLTTGHQYVEGSSGDFTVQGISGNQLLIQLRGVLATSLESGAQGVLPDGNYEITVRGDAVRNAANQVSADNNRPDIEGIGETFFFAGDYNHDRAINFADLVVLAQNLNTTGRSYSQGDANFDGAVNFTDLVLIGQRYGSTYPAPLTADSSLQVSTGALASPAFDHDGTATPFNAAYVEWTPPSTGIASISGYKIWRSIDGVNFGDPIATVQKTLVSYIDRHLLEGERYTYRVRPYLASGGYGQTTNKASVVTTLLGPTVATATAAGTDKIDVTWNNNSANQSGFDVQVLDATGNIIQTVSVGPSVRSTEVAGLLAGNTYKIRISAKTAAARGYYPIDIPVTTLGSTRAQGVDVSQGSVDWTNVHNAGNVFAYVQATDGTSYTKPNFATNIGYATGAGLYVGVYHHAVPTSDASNVANDAVAQASFFVSQAHAFMVGGRLRPFVDVSQGATALSASALSQWVNTFVQTVSDETGVVPIVHTSNDYALHDFDSSVANHDLWIVNTTSGNGDPLTTGSPPAGVWGAASAAAWSYWQYSNTGSVSDVSGAVDLDVFNGDVTQLVSTMATPAAPKNVTLALTGATTFAAGKVFSATLSATGADVASLTGWSVDWGDGRTQIYPISQLTATHIFAYGNRSYSIQASAGGVTSIPLLVNVTQPQPLVSLSGASSISEGSDYVLTVNVTNAMLSDPNLLLTVSWDGGDDQTFNASQLASGTVALTLHNFSAGATTTIRAALNETLREFDATPKTVSVTPAAASGLSASADDGGGVQLDWTNNTSVATGYAVESSTDNSNWSVVETLAPDATSYDVANLDEGSSAYYRVRTLGNTANAGPSNVVSATTKVASVSELASLTNAPTSVGLTWINNSAHQTGFRVEMSTDDATWTTAGNVAASLSSTTVSGLAADTQYWFRVTAYGTAGDAESSPVVAVMTALSGPLPLAPTGLTATVISTSHVDLAWTDVATDASGYIVERRVGTDGDWATLVTLSTSNQISYPDNSVSAGTTYYYRVRAWSATGDSDPSNEDSATTSLAAPTSLSASALPSGDVQLSWTDNSANEAGFNVYQSDNGGSTWQLVLNAPANDGTAATATVTNLTEGQAYSFYVTAATDDRESTSTNSATATPEQQSISALPSSDEVNIDYGTPYRVVVTPHNLTDALTWDIDWGDTDSETNVTPVDSDGTFTFSHTYTASDTPQAYTIAITAHSATADYSTELTNVPDAPPRSDPSVAAGGNGSPRYSPKQMRKHVKDAFQFVYNNIKTEFYPGYKKGPEATAATHAGNDWDQAGLLKFMIDKLYVGNQGPQETEYRSALITVDKNVVEQWLGLQTGDDGDAKEMLTAMTKNQLPSNQAVLDNGTSFTFVHTYLHIELPGLSNSGGSLIADVAPDWKFAQARAGLSIIGKSSGVGFNLGSYFSQSTQSPVNWYSDQVTQFLRNSDASGHYPYVGKYSLADISIQGTVQAKNFVTLPTTLPAAWVTPVQTTHGYSPDDQRDSAMHSYTYAQRVFFKLPTAVKDDGSGHPATPAAPASPVVVDTASLSASAVTVRWIPNDSTHFWDIQLFVGNDDTKPASLGLVPFGTSSIRLELDQIRRNIDHSNDTSLDPDADAVSAFLDKTDYHLVEGQPAAVVVAAGQVSPADVAAQQEKLNDLANGYGGGSISSLSHQLIDDYEPALLALSALSFVQQSTADELKLSNLLNVTEADLNVGTGLVTGIREYDTSHSGDERISNVVTAAPAGISSPYVFYDSRAGSPTFTQGLKFNLQGLAAGGNDLFGDGTTSAFAITTIESRISESVADSDARIQKYSDILNYDNSWLESDALEGVTSVESVSTIKGMMVAKQGSPPPLSHAPLLFWTVIKQPSGTYLASQDNSTNVGLLDGLALGDPANNIRTSIKAFLDNHTVYQTVNNQVVAIESAKVYIPNGLVTIGDWTGAVYFESATANSQSTPTPKTLPILQGAIIQTESGDPEGGSRTSQEAPTQYAPIFDSELANTGPDQQANYGKANAQGDPVNTENGVLEHDESDFSVLSPGLSFNFGRHYQSDNSDDSGLGVGWTYSYSDKLSVSGNTLVWTTAGGERNVFTKNGGVYSKPPGVFGTLTRDSKNKIYRYVSTDGSTYTFEGASGDGDRQLLSVSDRLGNTLSIVQPSKNGAARTYYYQAASGINNKLATWTEVTHGSNKTVTIAVERDKRVYTYNLSEVDSKWYLRQYISTKYGTGANEHIWSAYEYYDSSTLSKGLLSKITVGDGQITSDGQGTSATQYRAQHIFSYYPNGRTFKTTEMQHGGDGWVPRSSEYFTYDQFTSSLEKVQTPFTHSASHIDQNGNVTTLDYDDAGLLKETINPDGSTVQQAWYRYTTPQAANMSGTTKPGTAQYLLKYRINEVGLVDLYQYDGNDITNVAPAIKFGNVTAQRTGIYAFKDALRKNMLGGELTTTVFGSFGGAQLPTLTTVNGERRTRFQYDTNTGNLTGLLTEAGDDTHPTTGLLTSFTYTHAGQVQTETLPKGTGSNSAHAADYTTTFDYDPTTGLVKSAAKPMSAGGLAVTFEAHTYDVYGNPRTTTIGNSAADGSGVTTTDIYDALGRKKSESVGSGTSATMTTYKYLDDLLKETDVTAATGVVVATTVGYDQGGRQITLTRQDKGVTTYDYDAAGNVIDTVDSLGREVDYVIDSRNRRIQTLNPDGSFQYNMLDGVGRTVSTSTPSSDVSDYGNDAQATTTSSFDNNGMLSRMTDAIGQYTNYSYHTLSTAGEVYPELATSESFELTGGVLKSWHQTSVSYDALGRVLESRDNSGVAKRFVYDDNGNLTSTTQYRVDDYPGYYGSSFSLNTAFNLVKSIKKAKDLRVTSTVYDVADRPVLVTNANNESTRTFYDDAGRATDVIDPRDANVTNLSATRPTEYSNKWKTSYSYDGAGRLADTDLPAVTSDAGAPRASIKQTYYLNGAVHTTQDGSGHYTTYDYDYVNDSTKTTIKSSLGESGATSSVEDRDLAGQVDWTTDRHGGKESFEYDAMGRKTKQYATIQEGDQPSINSEYNAAGDLVQTTDHTATSSSSGLVTHTTYDLLHRATSTTTDDPASTVANPLPPLQLTRNWYEHGDVTVTKSYTTATAGYVTSFDYDRADRAITEKKSTVALNDGAGGPDALPDLGSVTDFMWTKVYGSLGTLKTESDYVTKNNATWNNIVVTSYSYDNMNRVTSIVGADPDDPNGTAGLAASRTDYNYDLAGNQFRTTVYSNKLVGGHQDSTAPYVMTELVSDGENRVLTTATVQATSTSLRPSSEIASSTYDGNGNVLTSTDGAGNTIAYTYDKLNRVSTETRSVYLDSTRASVTVTKNYTYDQTSASSVGHYFETVEDFHQAGTHGSTIEYEYDQLGRMVAERWYNAPPSTIGSGATKTIRYNYDTAGRLLWADSTYSGSSDTAHDFQRTYDALGRMTSERQGGTNTSANSTSHFSFVYSGFDELGEPSTLTVYRGSQTDSSQRFVYDYLGNVTDLRTFTGSATTQGKGVLLDYDQLEGETKETPFVNAGLTGTGTITSSAVTSYGYDFAHQLTSISNTAAKFVYGRDRMGRVTSFTTDGGAPVTYSYYNDGTLDQSSAGSGSTYAYDANGNRTDGSRSVVSDNRIATDGSWTYTYDERGNELTRTSGSTQWRYAYDNRNRLYNVQQWDTSTSVKLQEVQYDYDAEDRRIAKRVYQSGTLTSTEQYGLDGQNALLTTDAGLNVVGRYLFGPAADQVLGQEVAGHGSNGFQWLISDQEGSVRRVVDASGSVSKSIVYDAFGQRISTSGPGALPRYQYTGQQFDEEDKLGYFDARYYDPSQGRFVNQDPVEDGNNWYAYAGNDPVNDSDPSGLSVLGNNTGSDNGGGFGSAVGDAVSWVAGGGISSSLSSFRREAIADTAVTSAYKNWSTIDPAVQQQSFAGDANIYAAHQLGSALAGAGYATEGSQIVNDAWWNSGAAAAQRQANIASYAAWARWNTGLVGSIKQNFQMQWEMVKGGSQGVLDIANGTQDAAIGVANLAPLAYNNTAGWVAPNMGYIPSPDWSKDRIIPATSYPHGLNKFVGGQGAFTLLTLGASQLGTASELGHITTIESATKIGAMAEPTLVGGNGIYSVARPAENAFWQVVQTGSPRAGAVIPVVGKAAAAFRPFPAVGPLTSFLRWGGGAYLSESSSVNLATGATSAGSISPVLHGLDIIAHQIAQFASQTASGTVKPYTEEEGR